MEDKEKRVISTPRSIVRYIHSFFETEEETKMFISLIQITIASVAFIITLYNIHLTNRTVNKQINFQLSQKQSDITFRFQTRYEHIITELKGDLLQGKVSLNDYLYAYWGVQCDQYSMRCNNCIVKETFDSWMRYRYDSYKNNDTIYYKESEKDSIVKICTYREGFSKAIKNYNYPECEKFFIDSVFTGLYPSEVN